MASSTVTVCEECRCDDQGSPTSLAHCAGARAVIHSARRAWQKTGPQRPMRKLRRDLPSGVKIGAEANAALNGVQGVRFMKADVFELLASLDPAEAQYDVVVLDPPSFTKSRKNVQTAKKGYRELQQGALRVLRKGGFLLTASCSHHIEPDVFLGIVDGAARESERRLQLLEWRAAAQDHPTLAAVPETRYLKFGIFRAL